MTARDALIAQLRACRYSIGEYNEVDVGIVCELLAEAADALAALPPPADPPALVALVREAQRLYNANITREADSDELTATMEAYSRAIDALLAYPLPAAPPVTDTPQGRKDCVIGVYCQRHGFIHGQEAEELRERLEELGNKAVYRVLDEVDARDSLAYLEATNEPTPPDADPAASPQEDQ